MTICVTSVNNVSAQTYFKLGGGYGFDFGGMALTSNINSTRIYNGNSSYENTENYDVQYASFGKGIFVAGSIGVPLHSNIDVEMELRYNAGAKYEGKSTHEY